MKAVQLKASSPRLDAEAALAQGMGGQVYVDPDGNVFAVAESFQGWPISPRSTVLELKEVPAAWVQWGAEKEV